MEDQIFRMRKQKNIVGQNFQVTVWKNQLQGGGEKQFPFLVFDTPDYTNPTKQVGYNNNKKYQ